MSLSTKRLIVMTFMTLSFVLSGSVGTAAFGQETDDPLKIELYNRFVANRIPNPGVAYQAARDYLQKYPKDKDQQSDYLTKWVMFYERDERKRKLPILINEKNYAEAYKTGARLLADEPDYLRAQIDLGYAGYLAASGKVETFNAEALAYAKKAISAIESGTAPTEWAPFKGKDDTLAYLNYAVGFLTLKTAPDQAIDSLLKALKYESDIKKTPSSYYFLAIAYESGPYKSQSAAFQTNFANKAETPESKAALDKINVLMDRVIDAYARAIAAAGTDPKTEQNRRDWLTQLTNYYKFRHDGGDAGLNEFVASALTRPLPPKP